jgi:rhamnosyltransferase
MVSKLLLEYAHAESSGDKLAAVGPATHDDRTGQSSYFIVSRYGFPFRFNPNKNQKYKQIRVGFLISSGSLISLSVLDKIGGKREDYFIDHVDTEWCFRAKSHGFKLVGVHDAVLHHQLGDKVDKFWLGYLRHIPHHTALRDYYMFRNTLLMLSDVRIPILWQAHLIVRLLQFICYFLIFSNHRLIRLRMMLLGLFHGFKGVRGRLDLNNYTCSTIPKVTSVSR